MKIATHQAINLFLFSLKVVKKAKKRAIGLLLSPIKLMTNKYFFWKQISCEETKIVSKFFRKLSYQNQFQKQRPDLKLSMASHVFCCVFFFLAFCSILLHYFVYVWCCVPFCSFLLCNYGFYENPNVKTQFKAIKNEWTGNKKFSKVFLSLL